MSKNDEANIMSLYLLGYEEAKIYCEGFENANSIVCENVYTQMLFVCLIGTCLLVKEYGNSLDSDCINIFSSYLCKSFNSNEVVKENYDDMHALIFDYSWFYANMILNDCNQNFIPSEQCFRSLAKEYLKDIRQQEYDAIKIYIISLALMSIYIN